MGAGMRKLLSLLLAAVLIAGQWAGQLHALSHAKHDLTVLLASAAGADAASQHNNPPPLDHPADHCVAYHGLHGAAAGAPPAHLPDATVGHAAAAGQVALRPAEPAPFSSRAPPSALS